MDSGVVETKFKENTEQNSSKQTNLNPTLVSVSQYYAKPSTVWWMPMLCEKSMHPAVFQKCKHCVIHEWTHWWLLQGEVHKYDPYVS